MTSERTWAVTRTWRVTAESATKALDAALPGEHEFVNVHEIPRTEHDDLNVRNEGADK